jgi:2-dehydro-3-deoxyphosphogluconate aldolase/(4S)-4-hydroxy-2-oxoglutarate aldolase
LSKKLALREKELESVKREEVRARIEEIGIIPAVRVSLQEQAFFAAETVNRAGISIAEITLTVPGAVEVISQLSQKFPEMIVGAGTVLDAVAAKKCLDAGAQFLTSPGFFLDVVDFAVKKNVLVIPGAVTPTEVITAWKAGADLVKVYPCAQFGGDSYIRALHVPFPDIPLIAAGGVNQQTAFHYILAGATALGIGGELLPKAALQLKHEKRIRELARRFLTQVKEAREQLGAG